MFIVREAELNFLESRYKASGGQLTAFGNAKVIYDQQLPRIQHKHLTMKSRTSPRMTKCRMKNK